MLRSWRATTTDGSRFLHLVVLVHLAVAAPLLDLVGKQAEFLVAHRAQPSHIVAITAGLAFLVPAIVAGVARLGARLLGEGLHLIGVVSAVALISLPGLLRVAGEWPGVALLSVAVGIGAVATLGYTVWRPARTFVSYMAVSMLFFPAYFLLGSPASRLLGEAVEVRSAEAAPVPVVMIVFDSLSLPHLLDASGSIDRGLYPGFAKLAATSHWFRQTTTVAPSTNYALPAILTGRYPDENRLPTVQDYPGNLFALVGNSHEIKAFESITGLCPPRLCPATRSGDSWAGIFRALASDLLLLFRHTVTPEDLKGDLPPIQDAWKIFNAQPIRAGWIGARGRIVEDFLESVRASGENPFLFLHTVLPHVPWEYLPSGARYGGPGANLQNHGLNGGTWSGDEWAVVHNYQRHLLQTRFVDGVLVDTIEALERGGVWDRALVVVTADHGVSFHPGRMRRAIDAHNPRDVMPVPLFIKLPGQREAEVSELPAETIDIVPTIADVLGATPPWPVDGRSLFDTQRAPRTTKVAFQTANVVGTRFEWPVAEFADPLPAARRMIRLFGDGSDPAAIYRVGPFPELVGRSAASLGLGERDRAAVQLGAPKRYREVREGRWIPARVWGQPSEAQSGTAPSWLGVAVNGQIEAITRPVEWNGDVQFFAMVPETAFRVFPEGNDVQVYDLSRLTGGRGDGWTVSATLQR